MNEGSLFDDVKNAEVEIDLHNDAARLFFNPIDKKYYFFAEYLANEDGDNYAAIQGATIGNKEVYGADKFSPSDTYLILFWNVEKIDETLYSKVIQIEEEEMFYKKYVIYFTDDEMSELENYLCTQNDISIKSIIDYISDEENELSQASKLVIRILTKIPFWRLTFPKAELEDYDTNVKLAISRMQRDNSRIIQIKNYIDDSIDEPDTISDHLFNEYLGEF